MPFQKDRVKPTEYPRLLFHGIRSFQLLSSLVVAAIMSYFLEELATDHYKLPWTFILLFAVSLATILSLTITIILHIFYGLNPTLNTVLNAVLALIWAVAFSLLSWWSSTTITHVCSVEKWENSTGVGICRMYKALFSFALTALVSTLAAVALDTKVRRDATARGVFQKVGGLDAQGVQKGGLDVYGHEQEGLEMGRKSGEGWETRKVTGGYASLQDDTAYHGAGGAGAEQRRGLLAEDR